MIEEKKPIQEMTQEEARATGRWLEWWTELNKALAREAVRNPDRYKPIRN